ncbi:hypothetical protein DMENIID0001_024030 [Sergentomyia squamirostris]
MPPSERRPTTRKELKFFGTASFDEVSVVGEKKSFRLSPRFARTSSFTSSPEYVQTLPKQLARRHAIVTSSDQSAVGGGSRSDSPPYLNSVRMRLSRTPEGISREVEREERSKRILRSRFKTRTAAIAIEDGSLISRSSNKR